MYSKCTLLNILNCHVSSPTSCSYFFYFDLYCHNKQRKDVTSSLSSNWIESRKSHKNCYTSMCQSDLFSYNTCELMTSTNFIGGLAKSLELWTPIKRICFFIFPQGRGFWWDYWRSCISKPWKIVNNCFSFKYIHEKKIQKHLNLRNSFLSNKNKSMSFRGPWLLDPLKAISIPLY